MKNRLFLLPILALVITAVLIPSQIGFAAAGTEDLVMVNPTVCPDTGCAAGQRLNLRADFSLSAYIPQANPSDPYSPNLQLCLYAPTAWGAAGAVNFAATGANGSSNVYTPDASASAICTENQPVNTQWMGGVTATLATVQTWDSLSLSLRIPSTAAVNDALTMLVFEKSDPTTWTRTHQMIRPLIIAPVAANVYVAANSDACTGMLPCYINSGDDLADGFGTGLKDAVDAQTSPITITILGNYTIKSSTVLIDKPHTIQGLGDVFITYTGLTCTQPMLLIKAGATIRNLNINDGSCTTTHRDLVVVDSPSQVVLQSNDLMNGYNAVRIVENNGNVSLTFNNIQNNSGYGLLWVSANPALPTPGTGVIDAWANNIYGNQVGAQANCANHGKVQHNFWGGDATIASAVTQCEASDAKRLGAPILARSGNPGVDASLVTVTTSKQSAFNNQIGFQRSAAAGETGNTNDFNMVIVNHGSGSNQNIPFTGSNLEGVSPCSNFWDVFLPSGTNPSVKLNLFFKYNLSSGCVTKVNAAFYCGQTAHPENYPLWWLNPASTSAVWQTTGSTGQATTCRTTDNEIQLEVDGTGRPSISQDLQFVPFVVGMPINPTPTKTLTFTPTRTLTRTRTPTLTTYYRYVTTRAPSLTPVKTRTPTPTLLNIYRTQTQAVRTKTGTVANISGQGYASPGTGEPPQPNGAYPGESTTLTPGELATSEGTLSPDMTISATPSPTLVVLGTKTITPTPIPTPRKSFWGSLLAGSLLGLLVLGGGAWVLFRERLKH